MRKVPDRGDDAYLAKALSPCLVHPVSFYNDSRDAFFSLIVE